MSDRRRIRIAAALVFSVAAHAVLFGIEFGGETAAVRPGPERKVEVRLVPRRVPPVVAKEVLPPESVRKATVSQKTTPAPVAPIQPVQVAVREIPPVALPAPPRVPEEEVEAVSDLAESAEESGEDPAPPRNKPAEEVAGAPAQAPIRLARPLYRKNPPPEYPSLARRRHLQGTVVLEVSVSAEGAVEELRVEESSGHKVLDRAALRAVGDWLFEPGRRGGERIAM
ncbi:MAG: energy transducer TonB, partial [Desulfurivibrionaceae bacterium]|nr:energy transducer TonB [Desulfurivibrionaceae bacterium]